ncbi:MAG: DUF5686 family protein [Dysgonomonas sp.]
MKISAELYTICTLLLLLFTYNVSAQNINGYIVDSSGNPVAGVTIYIKEIRQGFLSNEEGRFEMFLDKGAYTFVSKKIGYKRQEWAILVTDDTPVNRQIILSDDKLYTIPNYTDKDNDALASDIIKNAIAQARIYANSVQYYNAYSYVNGSMNIKKIPDFIDKISYKINKYHLNTLQNETFVQEMYNKIEFTSPDNYRIKEVATAGNIPQTINFKGAISDIDGSLYLSKFNEFISPISHTAPSYYRYKYMGYYMDDNQIFHKIKVEPRLNDPELIRGDLYIADGLWYVGYAQILTRTQSINQTSTIMFRYFGDNIHLPVSYLTELEFNEIGLSADATYYSSVKYDTIISHKDINEDNIIPFLSKGTSKATQELKIDSTFWTKIRTIPPIKMDSLNSFFTDSISMYKKRFHPSNYWFGRAILGGYIAGNDSTKWSVRYNGMKMIFRDYNYVDGFWLGDRFEIKNKLSNDRSLNINPYIYYATARHRPLGGSDIIYNYAPKNRGILTISAGSRSEDFNSLTVTRYQNYFSSLVLGENYNSFYQRDFFTIENDIYLHKKLRVSASLGIEKRSGLSNNTNFNILNRHHIKPNLFPDEQFDRTFFSAGISYSPFSNYLIERAFDVHKKQISPVFHLEYEEGFSSWQTNNSKYRKLKGGVIHNIQLNYFNKIDYKIEAGAFLNNRNVPFIDQQHFGASDLLINLNSLFDSFLLLDNYEVQTDRYWMNIFFNYSGKYVLLKFIPFLQGKPFTENIHIKTLFTPDIDSYVELGYSVSITRNMGIGSFASFQNMEGKKFGIRFSFDISSLGF